MRDRQRRSRLREGALPDNAGARDRLRRVRILESLTEQELDELGGEVAWIEPSSGQEIISHLEMTTRVYFVVEGALRVRLSNAVGRSVAIRTLRTGSHFGEIAALTNAPRTVSVVAQGPTVLASCSQMTFMKLMASSASFATSIATSLAKTVTLLTDRVFELAALEVRFRIYAELLRLCRTGEIEPDGIRIRDAPTHEMIAAAVGTQREAVNRELRFLTSEGILLQRRREIFVIDVERLRSWLRQRGGLTATQIVDWEV